MKRLKLEEVIPAEVWTNACFRFYWQEILNEPPCGRQEEIELGQCIERGREAAKRCAEEISGAGERRALGETMSVSQDEEQIRRAEEARARLVRSRGRMVLRIASKFTGQGVPFLDLVQEGNVGLLRAVDRFDYRKGRWASYAATWVWHNMRKAIRWQGPAIRPPTSGSEIGKMLATIGEVREQLEGLLGRCPTEDEIAFAVGEPPGHIRSALRRFHEMVPLDEVIEIEEEGERRFYSEAPGEFSQPAQSEGNIVWTQLSPRRGVFDTVVRSRVAEELRRVLWILDPRERLILILRFGWEELSQREVGTILGLPKVRVQTLERQALRKLSKSLLYGRLRGYLEDMGGLGDGWGELLTAWQEEDESLASLWSGCGQALRGTGSGPKLGLGIQTRMCILVELRRRGVSKDDGHPSYWQIEDFWRRCGAPRALAELAELKERLRAGDSPFRYT